MTSSARYGVLLVSGSHTHQENYARAFMADGRCRVIGLTDERDVPPRRDALNRRLAAELDVPFLDDFEEAIHRDDVDIVCLCPEPERRGRLTARCARAGKHVYVDKPLASNAADARDVVLAVNEQGVGFQMFSLVHSSAQQRALDIATSGRLGELIGVHCELLFAKGTAGTADLSQPRTEKAKADRFTFVDSKRELFCVGLYPLVLLQSLTKSRVESVYASTSNYFFAEHQRNDVEDFSCLMMRTVSGVDATITVGRTGWRSHAGSGIHQIHLIGSDGATTIDAFRPRLEISSSAPSWKPPQVPHPEDPMGFWSSSQREAGAMPKDDWLPIESAVSSDVGCFLDSIDEGRQSDVPAEFGAHAVEVILASYRSAASGRREKLSAEA